MKQIIRAVFVAQDVKTMPTALLEIQDFDISLVMKVRDCEFTASSMNEMKDILKVLYQEEIELRKERHRQKYAAPPGPPEPTGEKLT